jgi:hypothetical protein
MEQAALHGRLIGTLHRFVDEWMEDTVVHHV